MVQIQEHTEGTDLREVLTGVRTTRLLASSGGSNGLNGTLEDVAELKGLDEVTG